MKRFILIFVVFILLLNNISAFGYTLVVGKIMFVNKNTAQIKILSKLCHGTHTVIVKNPQVIRLNLIHKVNFIMQIDKNCSSVIIGNTNRGPQ